MNGETRLVPAEQRARLGRIGTDLCFCTDRLDRERVREVEPSDEELKTLSEAEREILSPLSMTASSSSKPESPGASSGSSTVRPSPGSS